MDSIFLDVLNSSIAATWVVLAVVLARLVLKKAPRGLVCGLWGLVGLRLMVGGTLKSPFSLIPSAQVIAPESLYDRAPVIDSGVALIDRVVNPVYTESFRADVTASVNPLQVWMAVAAGIWVLGMTAMAVWAAVSCLRVRRQVRESVCEDGVYLCDRIDSPFIFGLFRPRIYLPSALDADARAHVIAHEKAHLARRDHWWKPLGFLLLSINWFNPAMWLAYTLLCRDIEMACDERVVRRLDTEEKKAYSSALLTCSVSRRTIAACPLAFGEVGVKARVKSVLNYKKPAFWMILAAVVLTAVLAACLLTDPETVPAEIRFNGILYVQEGEPVDFVPDKQQATGTLRSVLHDPTAHPAEDAQAVGLGWEYAGQPMVLVGNALYLEQPGGGAWLKFVPKHRPADVYDLLAYDIQCELLLRGGEVSLSEFLTKDGELELRELLNPDQVQMRPLSDWDQTMLHSRYDGDISIDIDDMDFTRHCHLRRRETDWLLVYQDEAFSGSAWTFESAALDAFIAARQAELDQGTGLFSDFATADRPICLDYDTYTMQDVSLRCAVPGSSLGGLGLDTHWERQTHISFTERTIHIQCRPYGRADWMDIWYYFSEDAAYSSSLHQSQSIGLANGASGTIHHTDNPERWDVCQLGTAVGQLVARKNGSNDWTDEEHRMATAIMGTIQLWQKGTSLLGDPNPLGITLSAENVTPSGLTLVCTQDGTPWHQITTGAVWSLEQLTEEGWVSVMPEDTYWTSIAYLVPQNEVTRWNINWSLIREALPPGTYRVGKHFSATPVPPPWLDAERESVEQNSYAEFVIE